ncbi:hypothetical protein SYNPS1DRAFT_22866, partial [Syncephalis pseudoplumigaleata]
MNPTLKQGLCMQGITLRRLNGRNYRLHSATLNNASLVDAVNSGGDGDSETIGHSTDKSIYIKPECLHLTLGILLLDSKEKIKQAVDLLEESAPAIATLLDKQPLSVEIGDLKLMKGTPGKSHVAYLDVKDATGDRLMQLGALLRERFHQAGLLLEPERPLKLHLTIVNTTKRSKAGPSPHHRHASRLPFRATEMLNRFASCQLGVFSCPTVEIARMGSQRRDIDLPGWFPAEQQTSVDNSTAAFTTSLTVNVVVGALLYLIFSLVRPWNVYYYAPRMIAKYVRAPRTITGQFYHWVVVTMRTPDRELLRNAGLDAYMFLRFLRLARKLFIIYCVIGLPVMMPLNVIGQAGLDGVREWTVANVTNNRRFWGHVICSYLFCGIALFYMVREMNVYIRLRHAYLTSPGYRRRPEATTMLITGLPAKLQADQERRLQHIYDKVPGGLRSVLTVRRSVQETLAHLGRSASMPDIVIHPANTQSLSKISEAIHTSIGHDPSAIASSSPESGTTNEAPHRAGDGTDEEQLDPTRDLIMHLALQLCQQERELERVRNKANGQHARSHIASTAFLRFRSQLGAQLAAQAVGFGAPLRGWPRFVGVRAEDVLWRNLRVLRWERWIRKGVSFAASFLLTLFWAALVTLTSSVATLSSLSNVLPFLKPFLGLPKPILGVIEGIVPQALIFFLMAFVPYIFYFLAIFEGTPLYSRVHLTLMQRYFLFQLINILLVGTFAGTIFSTISSLINQPTLTLTILARAMPNSSTFFINYVLLLSLFGSAKELLRIPTLLVRWLRRPFTRFDTPRKVLQRRRLPEMEWGRIYPNAALIFCT